MELYTSESILVSRVLDHLGYGKQMVTFRHNVYKRMESVCTKKLRSEEEPLSVVIVGSKGEGLTAPLENDFDMMYIVSDVVCKENVDPVTNWEEMTIFNLDMKDAAPGYTYLRAINISDSSPSKNLLHECLVELSPGYIYLSSDFWKNNMKGLLTKASVLPGNQDLQNVDRETHGPSATMGLYQTIPCDVVYALPCDCSSYLRSWSNRERFHQWPSDGVIREVFESESSVVPVGNIYSSVQFLEWRICFTKGEITLVQSLNDCLTKCLILLKVITKITLKPLSKDMSSYIVKNVIFWVAELNDYDFFNENKLSLVLKLALLFLKQCVSRNNLPSYMIPKRNLLSDRLTVNQRAKICMRIDSLLKEGRMMVHRWQKVRHAFMMLYRSPEEFCNASERRRRVQELFLLRDEYSARMILKPRHTVEGLMTAGLKDDIHVFFGHKILECIKEEDITEDDFRMNSEELEEYLSYLRIDGNSAIRGNPLFEYLT